MGHKRKTGAPMELLQRKVQMTNDDREQEDQRPPDPDNDEANKAEDPFAEVEEQNLDPEDDDGSQSVRA